jgi:hypothetical protein
MCPQEIVLGAADPISSTEFLRKAMVPDKLKPKYTNLEVS